MSRRVVLSLAAALSLAGTAAAQRASISDFAWLSGTRRMITDSLTYEEQWSEPAENVIFGLGRTFRGTLVVGFEFLRIEARGDTLFYIAQPGGAPPTPFRLTQWDGTEAIFENPEHDFPKRIIYARLPDGGVKARVDGGADATSGAEVYTFALPGADSKVDQQRAASYFREAARLCARDGGRLWRMSLCGPMVFADAATHSIATNEPAPRAPRPPPLGFANAAMSWGDTRWSTFVWKMLPADPAQRGRMMLHELFHRVQPQLGLLGPDGHNEHLDTLEGRYWIQLEWRALARALAASGADRAAAVRDALAFRAARYRLFPDAAENERRLEINEGLAQYTGTVAAHATRADAVADAIAQLGEAPLSPTLVRTFPYPSGAAYGLLLDDWLPGWTHGVKASDDLTRMLMAAAPLRPAEDVSAAARRYGAAELRVAEQRRDAEQKLLLAELRRRFVEGPVLVLPNGRGNSFATAGMTPIPGSGMVYPSFRTTGDWGSLEARQVLMATDRSTLTLPAPPAVEGTTIQGEGWTLTLAPGWVVRPGKRAGDYVVVLDR